MSDTPTDPEGPFLTSTNDVEAKTVTLTLDEYEDMKMTLLLGRPYILERDGLKAIITMPLPRLRPGPT